MHNIYSGSRLKCIALIFSVSLFPLLSIAATPTTLTKKPVAPTTFENYLKTADSCNDRRCPAGAYVIKTSSDLQKVSDGLIGQSQDLLGPSQWTNKHYALLIQPSDVLYTFTTPAKRTPLGFYTQIVGVGASPDDVRISPGIEVYNQCPTGLDSCLTTGALDNFWRSLENVQLANKGTSMDQLHYAVSQASPARRIHVTGSLSLCDPSGVPPNYWCGYASGGFIADSVIDNTLTTGSQQQWITRNTNVGSPDGNQSALWNMVLVGSKIDNLKLPTDPHREEIPWINFPLTKKDVTPVVAEKPYLTFTKATNKWQMVVPDVVSNQTAPEMTFKNHHAQQTLDVDTQFFIVAPDEKSKITTLDPQAIQNINSQLAQGQNLMIMPGVYNLSAPIIVPKSAVIFGLGLPTLVCQNQNGSCMTVSADEGVRLAGIIFEAGTTPAKPNQALLQIGTEKNKHAGNDANPNVLSDIYVRIAETQYTDRSRGMRQADTGIAIYSDHTIGDNLWIWRGDHDMVSGNGPVTWSDNLAKHGLVVYGDHVTMYGLFVEHFQDYQTVWYGDHGQVYFYQSEMPYDVESTDMSTWTCTLPIPTKKPSYTHNGCASYWVSPDVTSHIAQGLGVYTYFKTLPINPVSGVRAPHGMQMTGIVGHWLNGNTESGMQHLVEDFNSPSQTKGYSPIGTSSDLMTSDIGYYN